MVVAVLVVDPVNLDVVKYIVLYFMDLYIQPFDTYSTSIVYNIDTTCGIGDFIKFFMFALTQCIQSNTRLYYKIHNIDLEDFIKLKHPKMYITESQLNKLTFTNVNAPMYYKTFSPNYSVDIHDVFYFSETVLENSRILFPFEKTYTGIHIRLGDKFLETDTDDIVCHHDVRPLSIKKLFNFIESQRSPIFLCCDQETFKLKIKEKYNHILITNCSIGHSGLTNTTRQQVLDSVTELYILSNSSSIYSNTYSGFSVIAATIHHIPLFKEYELYEL